MDLESTTFEAFFASGRAVDFVLAVLAIEAVWLIVRGRGAVDVIAMLAPAAFILLGLRAALTDGPWWQLAGFLAASFPAHLYDLKRRSG